MKDVKKALPDKSAPKRRKHKRNLSLYYLLMLIFVVIVLVILSRTVLFNIATITVSGNQRYSRAEILSAADISVGDNMFSINLEKTEERVKDAFIYIDDIELRRRLPDGFEISVTEAEEFACCQYEGRYAIVSRGGRYLVTEQRDPREGLLMIYGADLKNVSLGNTIESGDEDKLSILEDLFAAMEETCPDKITAIDITDRTNITLTYENRIEIDFGSFLDYEYKLRYITKIIEESLGEEERGKIIYHSASAGASFIAEEDIGLIANPVTSVPVASAGIDSSAEESGE